MKNESIANRSDLSSQNVKTISDFIYDRTGILLGETKRYLIKSRLQNIVKLTGAASFNELCEKVGQETNSQLDVLVIDALTTNETFWFRDNAPFFAMENKLLPYYRERRFDTSFNIWCAACSSGQEPYSLAMLILESGLFNTWDIRITATDISSSMLKKAKSGIFNQLEINRGMPAKYLIKYFEQIDDDQWQVKSHVRQLIQFKKINLHELMPAHWVYDLILCRNVLIYFDLESKKKIFNKLYDCLADDGYLVLGGSESTLGVCDKFDLESIEKAVFYKKPASKSSVT